MNTLEHNLNKIIDHINSIGNGFGWKNHPNRNHTGVYLQGEHFDYCIIKKDKLYCFDAKETISDKWQIKQKDIKQGFALDKIQMLNKNYNCFFLIYFKQKKLIYKLGIDKFFEILEKRRYVQFDDCIKFRLEELLK